MLGQEKCLFGAFYCTHPLDIMVPDLGVVERTDCGIAREGVHCDGVLLEPRLVAGEAAVDDLDPAVGGRDGAREAGDEGGGEHALDQLGLATVVVDQDVHAVGYLENGIY